MCLSIGVIYTGLKKKYANKRDIRYLEEKLHDLDTNIQTILHVKLFKEDM